MFKLGEPSPRELRTSHKGRGTPLLGIFAVCGAVLGHISECTGCTYSSAMSKTSEYEWGLDLVPTRFRSELRVTLRNNRGETVYSIWKDGPAGTQWSREEAIAYGETLLSLGATAVQTALAHIAREKKGHNDVSFLDMCRRFPSETYVSFGKVKVSTSKAPVGPRDV